MDIEAEVMESKGKIRLNELKIEAVINILSKEGIITHEEAEDELNKLLKIEAE